MPRISNGSRRWQLSAERGGIAHRELTAMPDLRMVAVVFDRRQADRIIDAPDRDLDGQFALKEDSCLAEVEQATARGDADLDGRDVRVAAMQRLPHAMSKREGVVMTPAIHLVAPDALTDGYEVILQLPFVQIADVHGPVSDLIILSKRKYLTQRLRCKRQGHARRRINRRWCRRGVHQ